MVQGDIATDLPANQIAGIGGSWFEYGGDYKWKWQRDFFDLGNAKEIFFEMAGAGLLNDIIKNKISRQARGELLPGHYPIGPKLSKWEKVKNLLAMIKIVLFPPSSDWEKKIVKDRYQ